MDGERRNFTRVSWDGVAVAEMGGHAIHCRGVDLSITGVALSSSWYAYPNHSVEVKMSIEGRVVLMRGVVVWSRKADRGYRCGVRFTVAHADCRRHVDAYVKRKEAQARTPPSAERSSLPPGVPMFVLHDRTQRVDTVLFDTPEGPGQAPSVPWQGVPAYVPRDATERAWFPEAVSPMPRRDSLPELPPLPPLPLEPRASASAVTVLETLPPRAESTAKMHVNESRHARVEQMLATVPRRPTGPSAPTPERPPPRRPRPAARRRRPRAEPSGLLRLYQAALDEIHA